MKRYNKLDKIFGPMAFAGVVLFFYMLYVLLDGLISSIQHGFVEKYNGTKYDTIHVFAICTLILLIGAFVGFTAGYTQIDYEKRRIKYGTKLFGIIFIGKWTNLTPDMKLGTDISMERWGGYTSAGTMGSMSFDYTNVRIMLYDAQGTEIIPVKKIKKPKNAETELEKMSKSLNLDIIE